MRRFSAALKTLTLTITLTASTLCSASPASMETLRLRDQHDTPIKISANVRYVIFAHDMPGKDLVKEMLKTSGDNYLTEQHALFVTDISGMPRIIARMFAYPAMRKAPYQILIDEVGSRTGDWERQDSAVTLFRLQEFAVTGYEFIDSPEALAAAISRSADPAGEAPQAGTPTEQSADTSETSGSDTPDSE
ncbi:MAG: hypothetical protein LRY72_18200 [Saccharospirillaceae bacterium]|nr:hypothetical protein [Saccharospirillaceae bacterium]